MVAVPLQVNRKYDVSTVTEVPLTAVTKQVSVLVPSVNVMTDHPGIRMLSIVREKVNVALLAVTVAVQVGRTYFPAPTGVPMFASKLAAVTDRDTPLLRIGEIAHPSVSKS